MKHSEIDLFRLSLIGIAAVGGLMAGTCVSIRRILSNGEARLAIIIGYAFMGLSGGILGSALGVFFPLFDVESPRGALVMGAMFGLLVIVTMVGANIGSILTFRYMGMRITLEPDDVEHDRRRYSRRGEDQGHDKTRD